MKRRKCIILVGLTLACVTSAQGESVEWLRQLGTNADNYNTAVSADGLGNVYLSGYSCCYLGAADAFISEYDDAGNLRWTRQFGTSGSDHASDIQADGLGNIYVVGNTNGDLGGPRLGGLDAFVSKYNDDGNLLWTRKLGTRRSDSSADVSADGLGNIYVSGYTAGDLDGPNAGEFDAFLGKYDEAGNLLWKHQLGTSSYESNAYVSADGLGNVYLGGFTEGSLGAPNAGYFDVYLGKFDDAGNLLWMRQFGTSGWDTSHGLSADGLGNVYISGQTEGSLGGPNAGGFDAFVSKYDDAGELLWTRQFGTVDSYFGATVSADGFGNVYIMGEIEASLGGVNAGGTDVFVVKLDAAGNLLWTRQFGTATPDWSAGVSADGLGNVYFSGTTKGSLGGPHAGGADAFLGKIVPEPSSLALVAICILVSNKGCRIRFARERKRCQNVRSQIGFPFPSQQSKLRDSSQAGDVRRSVQIRLASKE